MYNFDVIFLILGSTLSEETHPLWLLQKLASESGFHTTIATQAQDIRSMAERLRVIVADVPEDASDHHLLHHNLNRLKNARPLLLNRETCLSLLEQPRKFRDLLVSVSLAYSGEPPGELGPSPPH